MTTRRKLDVGSDGMADVLVLTDPIPRHVSLVSWGANDRPAVSWKNAAPPAEVLRSPPSSDVVDISSLNMQRVQGFISETLDAWGATVSEVLATPLSAAERSSRVQALTVQAGTRIAAFSAAVTTKGLAGATRSYKTVGLQIPEPPSASTLQGELDRRQFMAGIEQASAAVTDRVLSLMRDSGDFPSITEGIMSTFHDIAIGFASWAASMPAGVVGVGAKPEATQNAGSRNSKADQAKLDKIMALLAELGATKSNSSEKSIMSITVADLQRLADEDPVGLITAIKSALDTARNKAPDVAKKFMWGETGVMQESTEAILAALGNMQSGDALASLIAQAVGGIDVGTAAETDNTQVAATMRSALSKHITSEITKNPEGDLAVAVKGLVEPSVTEAITESMKALLNGSHANESAAPFGMDGFMVPEDSDPLAVDMPGATGFNR